MKKRLIYGMIFLLFFWIGGELMLNFYGHLLFQVAKGKLGGTENVLRYGDLPDDKARYVVKPNPDFLYVSCFYDLSEGPLRILGDLPDSTYWSVSFFEPSTVNFFVKNDLEFESSRLDISLSSQKMNFKSAREQIISPNKKGLMLFRILVPDPEPGKLARYKAWQNSIQLKSMKL